MWNKVAYTFGVLVRVVATCSPQSSDLNQQSESAPIAKKSYTRNIVRNGDSNLSGGAFAIKESHRLRVEGRGVEHSNPIPLVL